MVPEFIEIIGSPWNLLPPGLHRSSLFDIENRYAYNNSRRRLFDGLVEASKKLNFAGCQNLYGSTTIFVGTGLNLRRRRG